MAPESRSSTSFDDATENEGDETSPLVEKKGSHGRHEVGICSTESSGLFQWIGNLQRVFGHKLLVLLFCTQHLLKGFAVSFAGRGTPYIYKSYGVPAPQMQIFGGVTQLPWALKPIIGLVSDVLPIAGYNKAPYVFAASALGACAYLVVGAVPESSLPVGSFVVCLFLISLQASTCDLLSEAKYAEKMQIHPAHGPAIMTYVWFGMTFGALLATIASGHCIHNFGPKSLYLVATFPAAAVLFPSLNGYFEEQPLSQENVVQARRRYWEQGEACGLCILMLLGTLVMIACSLVSRDPFVNCVASIVVAIVMLVSFSVVLSPVIAKANAFALIQTALGFSTSGASFYFYTDTAKEYPEGPHFSDFFYNSVLGVTGSVISLIGILCYQRYMTTWKYRSLLIITNVALALLSSLDIMMFARLNVRLGIPDHLLILGLSVFEGLIAQWQWMPQVVILSYLCPRGMEATMYALLAGCHNMGNTIAANCGALLLAKLGCRPSGAEGESDQFANLWIASTISTILPLAAVVLLIRLMPDARQNQRLVSDDQADATAGSLWRQWRDR